jgi:hypothetical protein
MAVCQHKYWSASLKLRGSRAEGDITREVETGGEEAEIELMLAIFGYRGRNTMGCCRMGGGAEGRSAVEESIWRDPHISPDQAQTEQSAQREKTMLMTRLESLQQRANLMKIELAPQNLNLYNDQKT